jgi:hypothetical protein
MKWLEEIKAELAEYERLATALPEYGKPAYLRDVPRLVETLEIALRALDKVECSCAMYCIECHVCASLASIRGEE